MNEDFIDFLRCLLKEDARFLVVGAHAMAAHGVPRATGDIDIWIDRESPNARRVFQALADFGAPLAALNVSLSDLSNPEGVIQIGLPPRRIDILTSISGVDFQSAWERRVTFRFSDLLVPVLGRGDLIVNKRAAGRPKDLVDVSILEPGPR